MKREIYGGVLAFALALTGWSCSNDGPDDDVIWDIYPVEVHVDIVDGDSHSLLNPQDAGNIIGDAVSVEMDGESYDAEWLAESPSWPSRAYMAKFKGIRHCEVFAWNPETKRNEPTGKWRLVIGEFPGDKTYVKEMKISCNGAVSTIRIDNRFGWKNKEPNVETKIYLNGQPVDGLELTLRR